METRIDDYEPQTVSALADAEDPDGGAQAIADEQEDRPFEEMRVLYICFTTGILVALIFLGYILASAAHALP